MNKSLPLLVVQWLNKLHIPLSSGYITEKLLSHPDYPSLASVTDILEDLNIEHAAMVVDKERLKEIPVPFLAHINGKQADFILVTDTPDLYKKHPNFFAEWDGIVLIAETRQVFNSPENEQWRKRDNGNKKRTAAFASVILILSVLALYFQFSRMMAVLIITTMAGVFLCLLLVQQELGMSNPLTRKLCSEGANSDCDAVLKSAASKTFSWLSLSDSGFIWFISLYLLLTISSVTGAMPSIITLVSILILLPLPLFFPVLSMESGYKMVPSLPAGGWCDLGTK
jgi:hypothetical protein